MYLTSFYDGTKKEYDALFATKKEALKMARSWAIENGSSNVEEGDGFLRTVNGLGNYMTYVLIKEVEEEEDSYDGILPGDRRVTA